MGTTVNTSCRQGSGSYKEVDGTSQATGHKGVVSVKGCIIWLAHVIAAKHLKPSKALQTGSAQTLPRDSEHRRESPRESLLKHLSQSPAAKHPRSLPLRASLRLNGRP